MIRPDHYSPSITYPFSCESSSRAISCAEAHPGDSNMSSRPNDPDPTDTSASPALVGALPRPIRPHRPLGRVVLVESPRRSSCCRDWNLQLIHITLTHSTPGQYASFSRSRSNVCTKVSPFYAQNAELSVQMASCGWVSLVSSRACVSVQAEQMVKV